MIHHFNLTGINQTEQVTKWRFFTADECLFHWWSFGQVREGTSSVTADKSQMFMSMAATLCLITLQLCTMCPASTAVNAAVCLCMRVHYVSACFCLSLNACGWMCACVWFHACYHRCFIFWFYSHYTLCTYLLICLCFFSVAMFAPHVSLRRKKIKKREPLASRYIFLIIA